MWRTAAKKEKRLESWFSLIMTSAYHRMVSRNTHLAGCRRLLDKSHQHPTEDERKQAAADQKHRVAETRSDRTE